MKKHRLILVVIACLSMIAVSAQGLEEPSEGKAAVYFLRTSGMGAAINFKFFVNETYLGKFSGRNYIRQELDAGEQLIWAKSENLDFMEANLKAGAIYLIHVKPKMGGMKAAVRLEPVDTSNEKLMKKVTKLLTNKGPAKLNMKKAEKVTAKIAEYLQKYEGLKNNGKSDKIKQLNPDMNYQ